MNVEDWMMNNDQWIMMMSMMSMMSMMIMIYECCQIVFSFSFISCLVIVIIVIIIIIISSSSSKFSFSSTSCLVGTRISILKTTPLLWGHECMLPRNSSGSYRTYRTSEKRTPPHHTSMFATSNHIWWWFPKSLHSLRLTAKKAPENRPKPTRKRSSSKFQGAFAVSFFGVCHNDLKQP